MEKPADRLCLAVMGHADSSLKTTKKDNRAMLPQTSAFFDSSAFRASPEEMARQRSVLERHGFPLVLNSVSVMSVVANSCCQLVFCNTTFVKATGMAMDEAMEGCRLGAAFSCLHASQGQHGCGSTEYCNHCGAFKAMMVGAEGRHTVQDCVINRDKDEMEILDLRVSAAPLFLDGHKFVVLSINDTGHEKRRRALEHIFFHDILNTVGGMKSILDFICADVAQEQKNDAALLQDLTSKLIDEIVSQKQLLAAENNELTPNMIPLRSTEVLLAACQAFGSLIQSREKRIALAPDTVDTILQSDFALLRRVLGNMLKNGLEATPRGGLVTLGCRLEEGEIVYWVKNDSYIPKTIQLKIFNQAFSTRGDGRGFGTYSIRLLTERYLGGRVDFSSSKEDGTVFRVRLPLSPQNASTECGEGKRNADVFILSNDSA